MSEISITREEADGAGRYVTRVDGVEAEMTFKWGEKDGRKLLVIKHTGVPEALGGHGVGLALVKRAVDDARGEGFKVVPLCSFARVMFERHKDWQDVLAE